MCVCHSHVTQMSAGGRLVSLGKKSVQNCGKMLQYVFELYVCVQMCSSSMYIHIFHLVRQFHILQLITIQILHRNLTKTFSIALSQSAQSTPLDVTPQVFDVIPQLSW